MTNHWLTPQGRRLAYRRQAGRAPGVVFLHGFNSDLGGTKAEDLAAWAEARGGAFLRFDLSGHGGSDGRVPQFGLTDWREDAAAIIGALTDGPQILVGSSLGGWLALLLARHDPARVAGVVTIAAAPDFTARMARGFTEADHASLRDRHRVTRPSTYGEDYVFSRALFDQGAAEALFSRPLPLPMPVRLLQGTADADVPMADALRLLDHAEGPDIRLTLVKDADHRFSDAACLQLIRDAVAGIAATD